MNVNDLTLPVNVSAIRDRALAGLESNGFDARQLEDAAVRFETVLVQKLMDTMRETIPDSGLTEDAANKQMWDLFYMHLGDLVGKQGGLGVWKQLAGSLQEATGMALDDSGGLELEL